MLKISPLLGKIQTLRVNNSTILTIKNAKLSGYYFYTNLNIWGDFQICFSVPLMTNFFNKFKKLCFWSICLSFSQFWGQKIFSRKSSSVTHNFIWSSALCQNFEKNNDAIPRKHPNRWKDRLTERQTLFHKALPVTSRVQQGELRMSWV